MLLGQAKIKVDVLRKKLRRLSAPEITVSTMFFSLVTLLFLAVFTQETLVTKPLTGQTGLFLIMIGFTTAAAQYLTNFSARLLQPVYLINILSVKVIFVSIIGFFVFGELPTALSILGGVLVVGGVFLLSRFTSINSH